GESKEIKWFEVSDIDNCLTSAEAREQIKNLASTIRHKHRLVKTASNLYLHPRYDEDLIADLRDFSEGHDFGTWNLGGIYEEVPMEYARKMGAKYGIFCATGTAGMHASLIALGLQPGDEVIVPSMTFIRAATPLNHLQLQPVIADIDARTGNISPESIKQAITSKTKAVVVVHMWGVPADCAAIRAICDEHNLKMIEDFSHAHYSKYKNGFVGSFGDAAFCSLQRKKTLSVGEGGLIVTSDADVFERLKHITSPGSFVDQSDYSSIDFSGFGLNMRMSPFSAVAARNLLPKIDSIIQQRKDNLKVLTDIIRQHTDKIVLPEIPEYADFDSISWYSYKPVLQGVEFAKLKELDLWKFSAFGYSPIASHNYWLKDTNYFPFNYKIKPIMGTELVGHNQYLKNRIGLNIPTISSDYWSGETIEKWRKELNKIN
ncbi:MAG: aminotransferase class I/II-fold pyridoxal phosphate-dependent enzyme, partial [Bacteroidota bacterium]